jgi:hypothetical protein
MNPENDFDLAFSSELNPIDVLNGFKMPAVTPIDDQDLYVGNDFSYSGRNLQSLQSPSKGGGLDQTAMELNDTMKEFPKEDPEGECEIADQVLNIPTAMPILQTPELISADDGFMIESYAVFSKQSPLAKFRKLETAKKVATKFGLKIFKLKETKKVIKIKESSLINNKLYPKGSLVSYIQRDYS